MTFKPSPWLFLPRVVGGLIIVGVLGYLWQGFVGHLWWSPRYVLSLAIPTLLLPCVLWVWLVPQAMEVSDATLHIKFILRGARKAEWSTLESWGNEEVMRLQFAHGAIFEIALFAFPRVQRRHLIGLLQSRYPDRKAKGWFARRRGH